MDFQFKASNVMVFQDLRKFDPKYKLIVGLLQISFSSGMDCFLIQYVLAFW